MRLNYYWRLIATGLSFTVFGLGGVLVPLTAAPVLFFLPGGTHARQLRSRKLVSRTFLTFIQFMRCLGILTWSLDGKQSLSQQGGIVVANHPTLLDIVFLVAFIPNANCIVKSSLMKNPAMRGFVKLTGYITNDSGEGLIEAARKSLQQGDVLIVFPEGTRTKVGSKLHFLRGAANIVIRTGVQPTPVLISCEPATLSKENRWYHIPARKFHMGFRILDKIEIDRFLVLNASLGSRYLTRELELFFQEELKINEHGIT